MSNALLPMRTPQENGKAGVALERLKAYEAGDMNANAIVSLAQDIYEAGVIHKLPPRYFLLTEHLRRNNLIHTHGRAFH